MLTADVPEFTLPINSSMIFGGSPAAGMTVGVGMIRAMPNNYMQNQLGAIRLFLFAAKNRAVCNWQSLFAMFALPSADMIVDASIDTSTPEA